MVLPQLPFSRPVNSGNITQHNINKLIELIFLPPSFFFFFFFTLSLEISFLKSHFICLIATFSSISVWLLLVLNGLWLFKYVLSTLPWRSYFTQGFYHHRHDHCILHLTINPLHTSTSTSILDCELHQVEIIFLHLNNCIPITKHRVQCSVCTH